MSLGTSNKTKHWVWRTILNVAKCSWVAFTLLEEFTNRWQLVTANGVWAWKTSRIHAQCDTLPILPSSYLTEIANNDLFFFSQMILPYVGCFIPSHIMDVLIQIWQKTFHCVTANLCTKYWPQWAIGMILWSDRFRPEV